MLKNIYQLLFLFLLLLNYVSNADAQTSGAFTPTATMITARARHTATLLENGKVLISGGSTERAAELFAPSTKTFSPTGDMTTPRFSQTATRLFNGRVLIVGGSGSDRKALASAELYDPSTGAFSPISNMSTPRSEHSATLLNDGKVLIAGGSTDLRFASAEIYNPATGTFTPTGNMIRPRAGHTATLLNDGRVLIAGGNTGEGSGLRDAELYDPSTGTFSPSGNMTRPRQQHTATLLNDGKVLIAGGTDDTAGWNFTVAELYDVSTGSFIETGNMFGTGPNKDFDGRAFHTATLLHDGKVLMAGSTKLFCDNVCHLIGDDSAETYNPVSRAFFLVGDMTASRSFHTNTLLSDGTVLIAGGNSGLSWWEGGAATAAAEIYVPSVSIRPQVVTNLSFDRTIVVAGSSFSVNVSGSNLTPETFFDVRFTSPDSIESTVVPNWQKGLAATHSVPAGTSPGTWTIDGMRPHEIETDHTGSFIPVSVTITVFP